MAAEQGIPYAQSSIAQMFEEGKGVLQDYKQAAKWYTKAAEQQWDQDKIGDFYLEGKGVPQSYVKAHIWYSIRAANGYSDGARKRDNVAEKMTSDQIAEAQRMAREMVEANPKLLGE